MTSVLLNLRKTIPLLDGSRMGGFLLECRGYIRGTRREVPLITGVISDDCVKDRRVEGRGGGIP